MASSRLNEPYCSRATLSVIQNPPVRFPAHGEGVGASCQRRIDVKETIVDHVVPGGSRQNFGVADKMYWNRTQKITVTTGPSTILSASPFSTSPPSTAPAPPAHHLPPSASPAPPAHHLPPSASPAPPAHHLPPSASPAPPVQHLPPPASLASPAHHLSPTSPLPPFSTYPFWEPRSHFFPSSGLSSTPLSPGSVPAAWPLADPSPRAWA
ncbi:hypothetical protein BC936DRAFT_137897 [Jimgerdemannia flammicorona]|uniref:Uncharacterized protein n=1 Tax=Jimgerdemannia flammicorona TaxID=994334 RepID=A0A433DIW7_9FUNG|nr:hypothetical protein BC936DRAFT_137897 [Jimgerdemannia flammicorona]